MNIKKTIQYKEWEFNFDWLEADHHEFTEVQFDKVKRISSVIEDSNVIFDVGANIGMYSTFFRHFYPNSEIYAFEAIKDTAKVCKLNTEPYNINVSDYGIWDSNTKLTFSTPKGTAVQSTNYGFYWDGIESENTEVEVRTLDSVCEDLNTAPDFLKIDVEGGEIHVLNGFLKNLPKVKYVMIEYRESRKELPPHIDVHNILKANGFEELVVLDKFDKIYVNTKLK